MYQITEADSPRLAGAIQEPEKQGKREMDVCEGIDTD